jgi:hypothetical protein
VKSLRVEIEKRREESLAKKQEALAKREAKIIQEREKLTKEIEKISLWLTRVDVEDSLERLTKISDKKQALKLQINFRRKVLCQSYHDSSVFKFSQNRKQHSVDRLKQNLFQLLSDQETSSDKNDDSPAASQCHEDILSQPELLVGLRIRHRFEEDGKLSWFEGTVLEMNSESQEFKVIYEGEDDPCWFPLLEDMSAGDLLII